MEEVRIYNVAIPQFLNNFKQRIIQVTVPYLMQIRNTINSQENNNTINPLSLIIGTIFTIYLVQNIIWQIFFKHSQSSSSSLPLQQFTDSFHQLNQLKKQLKSMKSSFTQLTKQLKLPQNCSQNVKEKVIQNIKTNNYQIADQQKLSKPVLIKQQVEQLWQQILPVYLNSLQNNKKLVNYVLETQFQVIKQLKKLKKYQRQSLSSGRPSTIRSRTSDKKIQTINKSPQKKIICSSQIKKVQIQNNQNCMRSQIQQSKKLVQEIQISSIQQKTFSTLQQLKAIQQKTHKIQFMTVKESQFLIKQQSTKGQLKNRGFKPPLPTKKTINKPVNTKKNDDIFIVRTVQNQQSESPDRELLEKSSETTPNLKKIQKEMIVSNVQQSTILQQQKLKVEQDNFSLNVNNQNNTKNADQKSSNISDIKIEQTVKEQQIKLIIPPKLPNMKAPRAGNKRAPPPPPRK